MKLSQLSRSKTRRVLIFGPPKSGKTELSGTVTEVPDIKHVLYFSLENGHETFFKLPLAQQEKIEIVILPDTRSFPIAIETMLKVIRGARTEICHAHGKVSCAMCKKERPEEFTVVELNALDETWIVIVDSLTQLTNSAIAHITKAQPEDYKLNYDDWANLGKLMDTFLSHVQQAKYNIICISHETETEMEDGKMKLVPTAGTRNFSRNTAKYFDDVIYTEVKNRKHIAASSSTYAGNILTGSRSDFVLESAAKPSLLPLFSGAPAPKPAATAAETALKSLTTQKEPPNATTVTPPIRTISPSQSLLAKLNAPKS